MTFVALCGKNTQHWNRSGDVTHGGDQRLFGTGLPGAFAFRVHPVGFFVTEPPEFSPQQLVSGLRRSLRPRVRVCAEQVYRVRKNPMTSISTGEKEKV
jgi:hypothetical protein